MEDAWDAVRELTPQDLADIRPAQKRSFFFQPFMPDGFAKVGENEDGTDIALHLSFDTRLYPVFGRVLRAHPTCTNVKENDVIWFRPLAYESVVLNDGREFCVMDERAEGRGALWGVMEDYDECNFNLPEMQEKPEIANA